jgi:hypothetical protein
MSSDTTNNCFSPCPCSKVTAKTQKGYVLSVELGLVNNVIQALQIYKDEFSRSLSITSISIQEVDNEGKFVLGTAATVGSAAIVITLRSDYITAEEELIQINSLIEIASVFNACFQEIKGVLVTSNTGTTLQLMSSVSQQATTARAVLSTINTLFSESKPSEPVKIWVATTEAEILTRIINSGVYICNEELI